MVDLLCEEVHRFAKVCKANDLRSGDEDINVVDIDLSASEVYEAILKLKSRLILTLGVVKLMPEIENCLTQSPESFNLDLRATCIAFDRLVPKGAYMMDDNLRCQWCGKVIALCTLFQQVEGLLVCGSDMSAGDKALLGSLQKKAVRAKMIQIYLDFSFKGEIHPKVKEIVAKYLTHLWIGLKEVDFTSSPKTFQVSIVIIFNLMSYF